MRPPRPGIVLLLCTCVWGSTFVVTKELVRDAPPFLYLFLRFGGAALLLTPLAIWRGRFATPGFVRDALVLGLFNAGGLVFQVFGQVYTTPAKSSFITSLNTPLAALAALVLYRTVPTMAQRAAVALASIGLLLLTWPPPGAQINTGDLLTVACATLYAFFIVESARRTPRHDAIAMAYAQVVIAALLFAICVGIARLAMGDSELLRLEARPFPRGARVAWQMAYMTVVCLALVMIAQTWALARLSAATAAVIYAIEPVAATVIAIVVNGPSEWPGPRGATGGMLVLFAVYVAEGRRRRTSTDSASSSSDESGMDEPPDASQPPDAFGAQ